MSVRVRFSINNDSEKCSTFFKSMAFLVVTPYSSEKIRRLGGTYRFHLHNLKVSHARKQQKYFCLTPASAGVLLGLLFDHEDGGDTFL
jgi:hypothetical protein